MEPFLGQITSYAFGFAIQDWAICAGQSLSTSQNTALYALLGTYFGGNQTNFNLPDLRGRCMVGASIGGPAPGLQSYAMGETGGQESMVLGNLLPRHTHTTSVVGPIAGPANVNLSVGFTGATMNVACSMVASTDPAGSDKPIANGYLADVFPNTTRAYIGSSSNTVALAPFKVTGTFDATATGTIPSLNLPITGNVTVTVQPAGNGNPTAPVSTLSPYQAVNHQIALNGDFPNRQ